MGECVRLVIVLNSLNRFEPRIALVKMAHFRKRFLWQVSSYEYSKNTGPDVMLSLADADCDNACPTESPSITDKPIPFGGMQSNIVTSMSNTHKMTLNSMLQKVLQIHILHTDVYICCGTRQQKSRRWYSMRRRERSTM